MNAHTVANALDYDRKNGTCGSDAYGIIRDVTGMDFAGPARTLILETLDNLVDSVGPLDDWRDIELRLENDPELGITSMDLDESRKIIGEMWNHGYRPDEMMLVDSADPLQGFLDTWLYEMHGEVSRAFVEYLRAAEEDSDVE